MVQEVLQTPHEVKTSNETITDSVTVSPLKLPWFTALDPCIFLGGDPHERCLTALPLPAIYQARAFPWPVFWVSAYQNSKTNQHKRPASSTVTMEPPVWAQHTCASKCRPTGKPYKATNQDLSFIQAQSFARCVCKYNMICTYHIRQLEF